MKNVLKKHSGFGLVELMISVTIGLIIMAGVIQLYASSQANFRVAKGVGRIQENMRYALSQLGDDIAQAGNIKCAATDIKNNAFPLNNATGSWQDFDDTYVSGDNNSFNAAQPVSTSDTLRTKRVDYSSPHNITVVDTNFFTVSDANNLNGGDIVVAGDCGTMVVLELSIGGAGDGTILNVDAGTEVGTIALTDANTLLDTGAFPVLYAGATGAYTYSIGTSAEATSPCSDAAINNCALFRERNNEGATELVQGVHGLQVQYGVEVAGVAVNYNDAFNADGNEQRISRIRLTLQFNSAESSGDVITRNVTRVFAIRSAW